MTRVYFGWLYAALKRRSFTVVLAEVGVPSILVKIKIKSKVRGNVKSKVRGNVKSKVRGNVKSKVRGNVKSKVRGNVKSKVRGNVKGDGQECPSYTGNTKPNSGGLRLCGQLRAAVPT
jgi:hypothetical protein